MMKEIIIPIATGLAVFIFGMQLMRIGFENLFLYKIKKLLHVVTSTPLKGLLTGIVVTALLQSSSAVALIVIGLTHARAMTLKQAICIILGANIGTVVTIELIAFQLHDVAVYFFVIGLFLFLTSKVTFRSIGMSLAGFGLLFIGMDMMQSVSPTLQALGMFDAMFDFGDDGILSGIISGTVLTAIIQSSTATTAITMNLVYEQLLPLTIAIAIALGSNIGTCFTAIIGSIGMNRTAKQVVMAHVILNVCGVLLFLPLIPALAFIVEWMTASPMHQVAHAQLIFNVVCSLIVLPFVYWFERFVIYLTPKQST